MALRTTRADLDNAVARLNREIPHQTHQGAKVAALIAPLLPVMLRIEERGNGWPSVGDCATDGSTVWRIIDLCGGNIQCGTVADPNYIEVVAVNAGEPSDFEEDDYISMFEASRIVEGDAR